MIESIITFMNLVVTFVGAITILLFIFEYLMNQITNFFKFFTYMMEFVWYRKQFKEWVKNKKRHPKVNSYEGITYESLIKIGFIDDKLMLNDDVFLKHEYGKVNIYSGKNINNNVLYYSKTNCKTIHDVEFLIEILKDEFR